MSKISLLFTTSESKTLYLYSKMQHIVGKNLKNKIGNRKVIEKFKVEIFFGNLPVNYDYLQHFYQGFGPN